MNLTILDEYKHLGCYISSVNILDKDWTWEGWNQKEKHLKYIDIFQV